ncbi:MAG TPA: hypothetical protein VJZ01_08900 [Lachnospiraceae bacterium]|nr:hypothetical protein [Lachnospiraceae bacterium]
MRSVNAMSIGMLFKNVGRMSFNILFMMVYPICIAFSARNVRQAIVTVLVYASVITGLISQLWVAYVILVFYILFAIAMAVWVTIDMMRE